MFSAERAGKREIEQHQLQLAPGAGLRHADVVGLDVAVGDALLIEVVDRLNQLFTEALQQVERQAGFFADAVMPRSFRQPCA
jgi:hypothetical protein